MGFDAFKLINKDSSAQSMTVVGITISNTNKDYRIAQTQTHETIMAKYDSKLL